MAFYPIGHIIRSRREELGLTQEELADGICSVSTLSRIENNERYPTKNHIEILLQRLGYSTITQDFFSDGPALRLSELKFKIRQAYLSRDMDQAAKWLKKLEGLVKPEPSVDYQFCILYRVLLDPDTMGPREKLENLETALAITCPSFRQGRPLRVLSFDEIVLLNSIAFCYNALGENGTAIRILSGVKEYYSHHIACGEESLRTQPVILYFLSKYLAEEGDYSESIRISDMGIAIARETGRCILMYKTLGSRARARLQLGGEENKQAARQDLLQAYRLAVILENREDAREIAGYYREVFGESPIE